MFAIPKGQTVLGIAVLATVLGVAFYILVRVRMRIARFRGGRFVAQIVTDMMFLAARPGDTAKIILLSIGAQISAFAAVWLILHDLGAEVSIDRRDDRRAGCAAVAGAADIDCGMGLT